MIKQKELDKVKDQFDKFDSEVKEMTLDRMNKAPKFDHENQTKLSSHEIVNSKDIYLKPAKTLSDNQKFNEKFRKAWEYAKEYVQFIAENKEIIGENIEIWTHPFGGVGAEYWEVPVNKPVWGPRYLAEQIKEKCYHRLSMQETPVSSGSQGQFYGKMIVENKIQRLDAYPASGKRSVFV